jgi:hypothetical protein
LPLDVASGNVAATTTRDLADLVERALVREGKRRYALIIISAFALTGNIRK